MSKILSILMPTYNHENYIAQAIESVLKQQTEYSYELLINDDCSTDNTGKIAQEYAKKYPDKITFYHQEKNAGLLQNYKFLLEQATGKYIAILESDDIWIDEEKMQKQVDFLESHEEYGLCVSDYKTIDKNGAFLKEFHKTDDTGLNGNWYVRLLRSNFVCAATICFSKKCFDSFCNIESYIAKNYLTFDYPILLDISANSKCHYIHEPLSAYRIIATSISNTTDYKKNMRFEKSICKIQRESIKKWGTAGIPKKVITEERMFQCMNKALCSRHFFDYYYYAKKLHSSDKKRKIIHYFSLLFYIQHRMRQKNPR